MQILLMRIDLSSYLCIESDNFATYVTNCEYMANRIAFL